jgi:uncharacterized protein (UPF0262 family)
MPVHAIRIEERLWSSATPLRKQEWRTLTTDIVSGEPPWPSREPCTLIAGCDESHLRFVFNSTTSSALSGDALALALADVGTLVSEYVGVIKQLSKGDLHSTHIETLDMAKRVVHDAGGRKIGALFPDLSPSFETRRRFFSLVVSLAVDTTRIGPAPGHMGHTPRGFAAHHHQKR